jgi:MFS transporter, DHA2 family, multidrug resistance protein
VQFVTAPTAAALDQRYDDRYLTTFGFLVFGISVAMSCIQTSATGYDQMFWPQVVRGFAVMFCILPPTRLALGHLAKADIPDTSGLSNIMQKLGGAIGIAVADTVIYSRAPIHAGKLRDPLAASDLDMLKTLGVTPAMIGPSLLAPKTHAILAPLTEKVAFVEAINDAMRKR